MNRKESSPSKVKVRNPNKVKSSRTVLDPHDLTNPALYINREWSALEFQKKILARAENSALSLAERLTALSIFFHNLDEFFMVRVMNLEEEARSGGRPTGPDNIKPVNILARVHRTVALLAKRGEKLWYSTLMPALKDEGIRFIKYRELSPKQKKIADTWFMEEVFPLLTPQAVDAGRPMPMISGVSVNIAVEVEVDRRKLARAVSYRSDSDDEETATRYARVKCPTDRPRFLFMPDKPAKGERWHPEDRVGRILLMEELIGGNLSRLFPGCRVTAQGCFRVTRNTEGEILETGTDDLLDAVRDFVETRRFGSCVRLELESGMPVEMQDFIKKSLGIRPSRTYRSRLPLAFGDFYRIADFARQRLGVTQAPALVRPGFRPEDSADELFATIARGDRLLIHPYDSFDNLLALLEKAALDPRVIGIKQTLYRTCPNSRVIKALLDAHRHGKQVTAVVELKARFQEENNITWAEALEEEGINVVYGFADKKIHAKTLLIVRSEPEGIRRYVHIGTGNYHREAARRYVDLGLLTADPRIADDVQDFFNMLSGAAKIEAYRDLLVSPGILEPGLINLIEDEIRCHAEDGKGHIVLKCNQLVDPVLIRALYRASQAGVKVDCIVRGICCLRPGLAGISERITVRSLVGHFHEHARVYYFRAGGAKKVYIGSADLMSGNFTQRIEILVPIKDPELSHDLRHDLLKTQLADTASSWLLKPDGSYEAVLPLPGEPPFDAQRVLADRRAKGK